MSKGIFEIYLVSETHQYYWRLRAVDGTLMAQSAEGYSNKAAALLGVKFVKENAADAKVDDLTT